MALGFAKDIRPYFTACFRAHMIKFGGFDLWLFTDVKDNAEIIAERVGTGSMPPPAGTPGACPEGGWDKLTRDQFLKDFQAWRDGEFQP